MKDFLKRCKLSPFGIAALAGILDLAGGLTSVIADIVWLVYDTAIKSGEMFHNPIYVVILVLLVIGGLLLASGIYFIMKCWVKYQTSGLEGHERRVMMCEKEKQCHTKRLKEINLHKK